MALEITGTAFELTGMSALSRRLDVFADGSLPFVWA